jgi:3-methyladenine DNA glycosylase AlkD
LTLPSARRDLRALANPSRAKALLGFFRTGEGEYGAGDRFLGLSVPQVRGLARTYADLPLPEIARALDSPWHEERLLALLILIRRYARATAADRDRLFRLYLRKRDRVNNWDLVDVSAAAIVGAHLQDRDARVLDRLARSASLWDRRIAIIATFHDIRRGVFANTLRVAEMLVADEHDLIHKAVGWMLREVGNRDRAVEERFLRRHPDMPRTMLRYAIEKFPDALRRRYLAAGAQSPARFARAVRPRGRRAQGLP